jgi:hypothetical protein
VFIPCEGAVRAIGRDTPRVVPAVELATMVHAGPHANIDLAYGSLATYVAQHALPRALWRRRDRQEPSKQLLNNLTTQFSGNTRDDDHYPSAVLPGRVFDTLRSPRFATTGCLRQLSDWIEDAPAPP